MNSDAITTPLEEPYSIASDVVMISAPVSRVWQVLTDFTDYGAWNRLCHAITVDPVPGGAVVMQVQDDALGKLVTLDYTVSAFEPERLLAWTGAFPELGLVARRDQYVQPLGDGQTLYWTIDIYTGPKASDLAQANGPWIRDAFNRMADSLRLRAQEE